MTTEKDDVRELEVKDKFQKAKTPKKNKKETYDYRKDPEADEKGMTFGSNGYDMWGDGGG